MVSNDLTRVAPEPDPSDFFEVSSANLPMPVRVEYSAIRDLRAGFEGNGERMGLLLGSISPDAVYIQRCELLALSPATLGDPKSLLGAFQQFARARVRTPLEDAPHLLGSFRTQATGGSGLRETDLEIAKRSFLGSDPLFLSIRTTEHRPWMASLYALNAKAGKGSAARALEFPFDEYLLRNGYLTSLVKMPESMEPLAPLDPPLPAKTRWIVAGVIFAVVLGAWDASYTWYRQVDRSDVSRRNLPGTGALSLKVNRSGSDFEVTWDRLSAAVQQSSSGSLTINDGELTRAVTLSGAQLREGRILYTPLFEELAFRLEVTTPDLRSEAESVQVLAWSGRQTSDVLTVAPSGQMTNIPPAGVARTKLPAPPFVAPKAESQRKDSVPIASASIPASVAKSAPTPAANNGKQAQSTNVSNPAITSILQPSPLNSKQSQDIVPPQPARAPETPPTSVASERPPVTQPREPAPVNPPATQPPAAPAPKAEPPAVSPSLPAASAPSLPPPAAAPTVAAAVAAPAPAPAAKPASSGIAVAPVPFQRVAPVRPSNLAAGAGTRSSRMISVRVMIDSAGSVQSAQVVASTPPGAFGEALLKTAALNAAKQWKFRPGQVDGKNVTAEYTIDFQFQ